ncbi:MAG: ATP-binding protein [Thiobacillaceae bacterium]|nr:ATP-binding protein [Thiobacillaceae bacterium]
MHTLLIPTLYVTSGLCAFAALHHGIAAMHRQASRIHVFFAGLSFLIMALVLAKAGAYQAQTAEALVSLRKLEVSAITLLFALFPWFIAEYTDIRPRKLLLGLTGFWALIFAVDLSLPYGVQFVDFPDLTYFELPWGERVVDLRVLRHSTWHTIGVSGILAVMAFSLYACVAQYRRGQKRRARALAWGLGLFFGSILFNQAVNRGIIEFIHLSDFGFISMLVLMDLEMMLESRTQKRQMADVLDRLPAAICLKDPQGRFQLVNRAFENFFQVRNSDILGTADCDHLPGELVERIAADEKQAFASRREVANEHVMEWAGKRHIVESHQFPLLHPDGMAYSVCSVYVDLTESRLKDESLHKFRRQVWHTDRVASTGAISGSLAHEICQPLSAILNNAQAGLRFLEHDQVDLTEIREILQDIVRDDKRAAAIINGLRAMLQQQETPYADLDLTQAIEEVLELLHSELIRHGVEVERHLEPGLTVRANKTQIQQVMLNLIINAQEAMTEKPQGQRRLQIRAARADGKALVSVSDTGIGIAEDMLDRIFEGFYTTKPQGLGVGLEVCRSIMESHRGAIWAEANAEGGATLHFSLPLAAETASTGAPAHS